MIDFLRSNPWCSQEEYKWRMTVPQVRLAGIDFTHIEYLPDCKTTKRNTKKNISNEVVIKSADDIKNLNDLGIPII